MEQRERRVIGREEGEFGVRLIVPSIMGILYGAVGLYLAFWVYTQHCCLRAHATLFSGPYRHLSNIIVYNSIFIKLIFTLLNKLFSSVVTIVSSFVN